jgi:hypothetical protein
MNTVIVDPDFLDHWRTQMLSDALGEDLMAPLYVIRIWAHCQNRRASRFDSMPDIGLKALCRFKGDAATLERALIDAGFIVRDGTAIDVIGWADHNSKLVANWKNGPKGGRPKQTEPEPNNNPNETQEEPTDNQSETQSEPIREEKRREELTSSNPNGLDVASDAADLLGDSPRAIKKDNCPHQGIIALYHEVLPMCPQIRDWTPARATQLRARWNEDESRQSLEYWRRFFEFVKSCPFLVGFDHDPHKKPFFADLEWLTKSSNFTKVREGKYVPR